MFAVGENLFHYTKGRTASDLILPTKTLLMSPLSLLNDPRESKTLPFKFYARARFSPFNPVLFNVMTESLTTKSQVLCFVADEDDRNGETLGRGFARPRMWAQYGGGHTGACLVFDKTELARTMSSLAPESRRFSGPVEYLDSSYGSNADGLDPYSVAYLEDVFHYGVEPVVEAHINRFHNQLFFTKHVDWRDET